MSGSAPAGSGGMPSHLRRLAVLSLHTSPLAQPGIGDAGGMNVYIAQTARRMAARGIEVEIFTRATDSAEPPVITAWPGVRVRHIIAGPFDGLDKHELPGQLCSFATGVLRIEALREPGHYDMVHSHYWLSGQVGYLVRDRWGVPLVHSAHTLGRVKNAALADDDVPEPGGRIVGEDQVIAEADRLITNTDVEAGQLIDLYGADPERIDVVPPGVDTDVYAPGPRDAARRAIGLADDELVLAFVGRLQPLKGADVLVRATALLAARHPDRRFGVLLIGGSSGSTNYLDDLHRGTQSAGMAGLVEIRPPLPPDRLVDIYRAADVVAVPSFNESFGLVALEAQAAGCPVVAAAVGGLPVAVRDRVTGLLVPDHDPRTWADRLGEIVFDPARRARMAEAARRHATAFSWDATVDGLLDSYGRALTGAPLRVAG